LPATFYLRLLACEGLCALAPVAARGGFDDFAAIPAPILPTLLLLERVRIFLRASLV